MTEQELNYACEWMRTYFPDELDGKGFEFVSRDTIIEEFRKAMSNCGDFAIDKMTWHKASEELPDEDGKYLVMCGEKLYTTVIEYTASPRYWHIIGYQSDVKYWMEIPEIKED